MSEQPNSPTPFVGGPADGDTVYLGEHREVRYRDETTGEILGIYVLDGNHLRWLSKSRLTALLGVDLQNPRWAVPSSPPTITA